MKAINQQISNNFAVYQGTSPKIMGILNVTPDSFSDGARFEKPNQALSHAESMVREGADIIDIGGESTRPGASEVTIAEEIQRVVPLIKPIKALGCLVSIDTSKPEVMLTAAEAGADMLNDVRALSLSGALKAAQQTQLPVCLMHMQGKPRSMQNAPQYKDVVAEVTAYLKSRIIACREAGIADNLISIDPGFGFGKELQHNLTLLNHLTAFQSFGKPLLVGLSRKSMLGQITGREVGQRMAASVAVALLAMQRGAKIIRVHDVAETNDVRKIFLATQN